MGFVGSTNTMDNSNYTTLNHRHNSNFSYVRQGGETSCRPFAPARGPTGVASRRVCRGTHADVTSPWVVETTADRDTSTDGRDSLYKEGDKVWLKIILYQEQK